MFWDTGQRSFQPKSQVDRRSQEATRFALYLIITYILAAKFSCSHACYFNIYPWRCEISWFLVVALTRRFIKNDATGQRPVCPENNAQNWPNFVSSDNPTITHCVWLWYKQTIKNSLNTFRGDILRQFPQFVVCLHQQRCLPFHNGRAQLSGSRWDRE